MPAPKGRARCSPARSSRRRNAAGEHRDPTASVMSAWYLVQSALRKPAARCGVGVVGALALPTDRNRPASLPQCQRGPARRQRFRDCHGHMSDCRVAVSSFSASVQGSPLRLTAELHPPAQHPGACGRGSRTGRARGVAARQERRMPFDVLLGDRRTALGGQSRSRSRLPVSNQEKVTSIIEGCAVIGPSGGQHVLADRAAVGPHDAVGTDVCWIEPSTATRSGRRRSHSRGWDRGRRAVPVARSR